jgi:hypothetical protein
MARPFGHVQRFVLAELDAQALAEVQGLWLHALTLATRLHGTDPSDGQLESVRRVLRDLAADSMVEIRREGVSAYEAADWADVLSQRRHSRLVARIPLDQRDAARAREAYRPTRPDRE